MAFWTQPDADPTRQYRFTIEVPGGPRGLNDVWWWARSIEKPSFEINNTAYQLGNHKFNFPGVLTWNPTSINIVDVESKANQLMSNLEKMGYEVPTSPGGAISKSAKGTVNNIIINQFGANGGTPIEKWTLMNVNITAVKFGSLTYKSDDLIEIELTIVYDYATYT